MKLGKDVPWVKHYKTCSKNLIPFITLVAMGTKRKKNANLYQVCSNNPPGVKTGPSLWVTSYNIGTKKAHLKILPL